MKKRPLRNVLHDAKFRLTRHFQTLPVDTPPYKTIHETLKDLAELLERGVGIEPMPVNTDILKDLMTCEQEIKTVLLSSIAGIQFKEHDAGKLLGMTLDRLSLVRTQVELEPISELKANYQATGDGGLELRDRIEKLKYFFADWQKHINQTITDRSHGGPIHPSISLAQLSDYIQTLEYILEGFQPSPPTATLEQAGPTIVLHEMDLWEVRMNAMDQPYLFDGNRHRAGVDLETDTYPLTMGRINYSILFREQWDAWVSDNEDRGFASRHIVEQKVLAYWRDAMEQVGENPSMDNFNLTAYSALLKFLTEVDEASGRMQALLVQDVPVFQRNVSTPGR